MKITKKSKLQLGEVSLTVQDIKALIPVCVHGIPAVMSDEMKEAIEVLVCLSINPLRIYGGVEL